eukprot:1161063-Pelagomonas_calceolata.AAC.4
MPAFAEGLNTGAKSLIVSVGVYTTRSWVKTCKGNVINAVHFHAQWAACRGGRHLEPDGVFLSVNCSRAGSGPYGKVSPLPATVIVARGISGDKLESIVHVCFQLVCPSPDHKEEGSVGSGSTQLLGIKVMMDVFVLLARLLEGLLGGFARRAVVENGSRRVRSPTSMANNLPDSS